MAKWQELGLELYIYKIEIERFPSGDVIHFKAFTFMGHFLDLIEYKLKVNKYAGETAAKAYIDPRRIVPVSISVVEKAGKDLMVI